MRKTCHNTNSNNRKAQKKEPLYCCGVMAFWSIRCSAKTGETNLP